MLRCGMGIKGPLWERKRDECCEGDGAGGTRSGLEMPESGLTFDEDGKERGPVGAELSFRALELWDGGDVVVVADLESS